MTKNKKVLDAQTYYKKRTAELAWKRINSDVLMLIQTVRKAQLEQTNPIEAQKTYFIDMDNSRQFIGDLVDVVYKYAPELDAALSISEREVAKQARKGHK